MCREIAPGSKLSVSRQGGFSIVAAIFLLVVLALLGGFIASVTGIQQSTGQLDVLGVRSCQSARGGRDWGLWRVLEPNNTVGASPIPPCLASPQNLPPPPGSLGGFA